MGLRQHISIEFPAIQPSPVTGVTFDDPFAWTSPSTNPHDIEQKDNLGRTVLMRAAVRGYDRQVEELLKAGADPSVTDDRGRNILEQVPKGQIWIINMLEKALDTKHDLP